MPGASDPNFDLPITGSLSTLNAAVGLDPIQKESQAVSILGTWVGTIGFEASNDSGITWFSIFGYNVATRALVQSTTSNGNFNVITAGYGRTRVKMTAYTSGTANVANEGGTAIAGVMVFQDNASGLKAKAQLQDDSGAAITLGIKAAAASIPVVLPSDGVLPLPSGAATAANQATQITSLQLIDDAPHAQNAALSKGIPAMGQLDDAATTAAAEDAVAVARITPQRALHTNLRNQAGTEVGTASAPVRTDPTGTTTQPIGGKNPSGTLQEVCINRDGQLVTSISTDKSVFGALMVASRVQQIAVDFSQSIANNNLNQTTSGTGSISLSNSNATISTGTGTTSSAQLQTISSIVYTPGREFYTQFTAAFTTPTNSASLQSAGLYNGTDGLLIGFNGLNFGVTSVAGGASTFVPASSFNIDTLTGAANSLFTRGGTPEAVNFTYKNVYRIRAGWLGAAPIYFEILSPDGNWITFHIIRQPNTSVNPAFFQPSLPLTMLVSKTAADATNLKIVTTSWDAGTADLSGETDINGSGTISALNGTVVINTKSRSTVVMDVTGTWSGTLQVQGDVGDGSWNPIYAIDTNAVASQTLTANKTLMIGCAGFNTIRLIATAWTSGTANAHWTASQGVQAIIAQVVGNIASGQADAGNPIKVGGVYNSVLPTVSSGQRVDLQLDSSGRLLTSTAVTSSLPAASFSNQHVITNGATIYTAFTASQKLAIKQFYAGGTGIGRQTLYSYFPSNTLLLNSGDFETAGDVANWPYFSNGGAGTGTATLSTTQAFTGTHSEAVTFTTSDANHSNGIKQIFGTPLDISGWRYITAEFFNTLSVGAAYTRTISIVITDSNANTRKFDVSGLSTAAPFNASNWIKITGEIANPTSATGTTFDVTSVASIELRMIDSASRAGTVYWDTARLEAQITPIFPIYHYQNTSFNIAIDPVFVMNIGDQILIAQTNNDISKQEYYALAGGVSI